MKDDRVTIMAGKPKQVVSHRLEADLIAAICNRSLLEGVTQSRMFREVVRAGAKALDIWPESQS